jgi:glycosyltransferase involved in cell wall biosynthesis
MTGTEDLPKVSIITVCYNSVQTIEQTIQSVVNQTYRNIEYIIIDGGSTDGTVDLIRQYDSHLSYWVSESDKGIYDAMNKGIRKAKGDIIGIINSDDWYEPNAVSFCVHSLLENSSYDGVCGNLIFYQESSKLVMREHYCSIPGLDALKKRMTIAHPTVFVRKDFYKKYGLFDTCFKIAADYDLLLRASMLGAKIGYIPHTLVNFRLGGISSQCSFRSVIDVALARRKNQVELSLQLQCFCKDILIYCLSYIKRKFQ